MSAKEETMITKEQLVEAGFACYKGRKGRTTRYIVLDPGTEGIDDLGDWDNLSDTEEEAWDVAIRFEQDSLDAVEVYEQEREEERRIVND